ncbi:glutathione synthetase, putative [Pediculus humanus corporis]|uniref:Glutathione synthetase n=1 Tax=Pediculus humanus subsp. corporis TaxID=121224 RepID=E0VGR8_PEDHC|nr:glutathione synthetase, putative [Pediculus humanus corporis]EEB12574.1 glutathione synthetase, putative [Pediculus humanus corporis]
MEAPRINPCLSLPIDKKIFSDLVDKTKDWALMHGAGMRSKTNFNLDSLNFAPFVLFPSSFPRSEFEKAINIQIVLNELIHKVAHDHMFLTDTLSSTIKVDEFTKKLFEIYECVYNEGFEQDINLGLFRVDYLLDHCEQTSIKQVEMNTVSVSFAGACTQLTGLHRFVLQELNRKDLLKNLPSNDALSGICLGMLDAWKIYNNPFAVILFIVEDRTYNICDQRFHEFEIRRLNPNVTVIRKSLTQVYSQGSLTSKKQLMVDGYEVALVYFRSGYEPNQYHGKEEWDARLMMERSVAIKCPSIHYHLAGTKKVQQALAQPKVLEKFIKDSKTVEMIRDTFTGLYSLDFTKEGEEAVEMAINDPEKFVLKPQREGGGNNIYGKEVKDKILSMKNSEERMGWILMDRIFPPVQATYIIRPGTPVKHDETQDIVSELGIFGCIIGDKDKIYVNRQVGHMFRTKPCTANEGGVAGGVGCLDSPFLIDD